MSRFTLPRDIYYGANALENLKNLKGSRAVLVLGGGSMKKFGFVDKALGYLKEAGIETRLIENVEPDPSVETVMSGAAVMREFEPDWIISMGGGSPIDAAKAMWAFYEYPETTFEDLITPFSFPELRQKARFCAIPPPLAPPPRSPLSPSSPTTRRASSTPWPTSISPPTWPSSTRPWPRPCPPSWWPTPAWTP